MPLPSSPSNIDIIMELLYPLDYINAQSKKNALGSATSNVTGKLACSCQPEVEGKAKDNGATHMYYLSSNLDHNNVWEIAFDYIIYTCVLYFFFPWSFSYSSFPSSISLVAFFLHFSGIWEFFFFFFTGSFFYFSLKITMNQLKPCNRICKNILSVI